MKKVLFFMPDNPLKKNAGNKIRALSFLQYFKSRDIHVDFVSEYFWGEWNQKDIEEFQLSALARNTFIIRRKPSKKNLLNYIFGYKIPNFFYRKKLSVFTEVFPELVTFRLKKHFNRILQQNKYDYIFINYASWSSLIEENKHLNSAKTVIDTHDFLTAQHRHRYSIGSSFQEEIRRLSLFDQVLAISVEEQYIFSQFCQTKVALAPAMLTKPTMNSLGASERKFDIIYVASKNPHNIEAANWFMTEVYPQLPSEINLCFIGQITEYIRKDHVNITLVPFAENLSSYYQDAKIAICPMLSGTGTKIKVIEALSYQLPVVCNLRGVDGMINKSDNGCLVSDDPIEFAQYILDLLNNSKLYYQQSRLAKLTFESNYEQQNCYKRLDSLF
jgi:glycosyltransferase involved in cell wall biosynthesis